MEKNTYQILTKSCKKFHCEKCDYLCSRKTSFEKHILSAKHQNTYQYLPNTYQKLQKNIFFCNCGKFYKHKQSLNNHKKLCNFNEEKVATKEKHELYNQSFNETYNEKKIIISLLEQNNNLQNQIIELCKEKTININNTNSNINSNNKSFNLNLFLNETCKDAMNIMDFIDSIKLQLCDLEIVGEIGYVDGISNIITTNLKALDVTQRPIHCADKKREILYVKDENKWEKEDDEKNKLRKAIKRVVSKNQRLLPAFKEVHPDCIKSSSPFSDQYNKMIVESMGGSGDNDLEKEDKIIKKISKEVVINKTLEINYLN